MGTDIEQVLELFGIGMGGIFIVMFLLFVISQLVLKFTKSKVVDESK